MVLQRNEFHQSHTGIQGIRSPPQHHYAELEKNIWQQDVQISVVQRPGLRKSHAVKAENKAWTLLWNAVESNDEQLMGNDGIWQAGWCRATRSGAAFCIDKVRSMPKIANGSLQYRLQMSSVFSAEMLSNAAQAPSFTPTQELIHFQVRGLLRYFF